MFVPLSFLPIRIRLRSDEGGGEWVVAVISCLSQKKPAGSTSDWHDLACSKTKPSWRLVQWWNSGGFHRSGRSQGAVTWRNLVEGSGDGWNFHSQIQSMDRNRESRFSSVWIQVHPGVSLMEFDGICFKVSEARSISLSQLFNSHPDRWFDWSHPSNTNDTPSTAKIGGFFSVFKIRGGMDYNDYDP